MLLKNHFFKFAYCDSIQKPNLRDNFKGFLKPRWKFFFNRCSKNIFQISFIKPLIFTTSCVLNWRPISKLKKTYFWGPPPIWWMTTLNFYVLWVQKNIGLNQKNEQVTSFRIKFYTFLCFQNIFWLTHFEFTFYSGSEIRVV